jgi:hypothetical protein
VVQAQRVQQRGVQASTSWRHSSMVVAAGTVLAT